MAESKIVFRRSVPLAPLSTFRIGGRAEHFYQARTPLLLLQAIEQARRQDLPYRIFAGGSNVMFPDGVVRGLVIQFQGGRIVRRGERDLLVDAGVPLARLVRQSLSLGFKGLETLAGIPGTVGGAVVGNAGAYGRAIAEAVERVHVFDGKCSRWLSNRACGFGYRESIFKRRPLVVLRVMLRFRKGDVQILRKIARDIVVVRSKKYPRGLRCPGSFFKNVLARDLPKRVLRRLDLTKIVEGKVPAGYLLEAVGGRGMRCGKLAVADYHGNLIVNRGGAKARDVRRLAELLKKKVFRRFGILLEEEVRYF